MRSSNKSRSRNKNNRNRNHNHNQNHGANVVNRVFDSSGPEGKVRGTPQQIIDKYRSLASDAQLSGDRVAAENFVQHAEHYTRMLNKAQREMTERREAQEAQRAAQEAQRAAQEAQRQAQQAAQAEKKQSPKKPEPAVVPAPAARVADEQPEIPVMGTADLFPGQDEASNLVQTPESRPAKPKSDKPRARRKPVAKKEEADPAQSSSENVAE